jgi:hypothetical protein
LFHYVDAEEKKFYNIPTRSLEMSKANLDYEMLLDLMLTLLKEVKAEAIKYNLSVEDLVSLDLVSML